MIEMLPMVPSAEERVCTCHPSEAPKPCSRRYAFGECVAYRDGFTAGREAERAAIIAMLRESSERMREIALIADRHGTATVLRALAGYLESQPKAEEHDG